MSMKAFSLFTGAGGFDLGFEAAGIQTVGMAEPDEKCQAVLARRWPGVQLFDRVEEVNDIAGADLIHGGFPCQDISLAGGRAGLAGERSGLWGEFHRILDQARPTWAVVENVAGLLSSGGRRDLGAILGALGDLGYGFAYRMLDARWFGVPQRRRRVFIVGCFGDARRAGQVLLELEGVRRDSAPSRTAGEDLAGTLGGGTPGRGWSYDTDRMTFLPTTIGTPSPGAHPGGLNGQDAYTGQVIPFHPTQDPISSTEGVTHCMSAEPAGSVAVAGDSIVRRLTPVECERLMGWPDGHTEPAGADSHRYRLCGNGVVAPVAEWIGRRIIEAEL